MPFQKENKFYIKKIIIIDSIKKEEEAINCKRLQTGKTTL
jgi:hypothetical protein